MYAQEEGSCGLRAGARPRTAVDGQGWGGSSVQPSLPQESAVPAGRRTVIAHLTHNLR